MRARGGLGTGLAALLATAAIAGLAAPGCGAAPPRAAAGPTPPQRLALALRVVRDAHVHRAVAVPEFLRELPATPEAWLRLEFRDPAGRTGVLLELYTECPEIEPRAVPCGGGRACLVSWRGGQELVAGRAALSVGEHFYWWPGPVTYCARLAYALGPGPFAADLDRFVLELPRFVRPARLRPPASAPAPATAPPATAAPPAAPR